MMNTTTYVHDSQTIERDLRIIIATDTALPSLIKLNLATKLSDIDFNAERLLSRLEVGIEEAGDPEEITFGDIVELIGSKPAVHQKLGELAAEANIRRLLMGVLAIRQQPASGEVQRWWYELVRQVLWWYARQSSERGLKLIQQGIPARAIQSLMGLGLIELDVLAKDKSEDAVTFIDVLERLKYPNIVATDIYQTLVGIAKRIVQNYDGRVQQLLRHYANQMIDSIGKDLLSDARNADFLKEAIRGWVSSTTTLPI